MSSSDLLSNCLKSTDDRAAFLKDLRAQLPSRRWFAGKAKQISTLELSDVIDLSSGPDCCGLVVLDVAFTDGARDQYLVPVSIPRPGEKPAEDDSPRIWRLLLQVAFAGRESDERDEAQLGKSLRGIATEVLDATIIGLLTDDKIHVHAGQQSNTSVAIGDSYFLKLFRRPKPGINLDAEIGMFLTGRFENSPPVAGTIEHTSLDREARCIAILGQRVNATSDAWAFCLQQLGVFWERIKTHTQPLPVSPPLVNWHFDAPSHEIPHLARELIGDFLDDGSLLGRRTGELHVALDAQGTEAAFAPEPLTTESLATLLAGVRQEIGVTAALLKDRQAVVNQLGASRFAAQFTDRATALLDSLSTASAPDIDLIRVHGDYHLGQVLRTTNDFHIIDFEGEPDRPLAERQEKRPAMKDVAGMVRSFHYASNAGAVGLIDVLQDLPDTIDVAAWQQFWFACTASCYLQAYAAAVHGTRLLPRSPQDAQRLLDVFLLEKAMYELRYELNNRPDWARIPLIGLAAAIDIESLD